MCLENIEMNSLLFLLLMMDFLVLIRFGLCVSQSKHKNTSFVCVKFTGVILKFQSLSLHPDRCESTNIFRASEQMVTFQYVKIQDYFTVFV